MNTDGLDSRALHLVPLVAAEPGGTEWVESHGPDWNTRVSSLCGKADTVIRGWTRRRYLTDGKVECAQCIKRAERLIKEGQVSA